MFYFYRLYIFFFRNFRLPSYAGNFIITNNLKILDLLYIELINKYYFLI